jgi:NAD(P)-dependent dehydrogenase (short-subunit alcohol dehydrogenase family)
VVVADVDVATGEQTAAEIVQAGGSAAFVACDVAVPEQVEALMATAAERYGGPHVLVNNAGLSLLYEPFLEMTLPSWQRVIDVNLTGVFLCSQAAARRMCAAGGGRIINIASINSFRPEADVPHYAASKGGVLLLTMSMARDLAPLGILVNAIAPGPVRTERSAVWDTAHPAEIAQAMAHWPLRRRGETDEIAAAAVFLASDESTYVCGHTLVVDGGYLLV